MKETISLLVLVGTVLTLFAYVGISMYGTSTVDRQCAQQGGVAVRSVSNGAVCIDKTSIIKLKQG